MIVKLTLGEKLDLLLPNFTDAEKQKLYQEITKNPNGITIEEIAFNYENITTFLRSNGIDEKTSHDVAIANMKQLREDHGILFNQLIVMNILEEVTARGDLSFDPKIVHAIRMAYKKDEMEFAAGQLFKALDSGKLPYNGTHLIFLKLKYPLTSENVEVISKLSEGIQSTEGTKYTIPQIVTESVYPVTRQEAHLRTRLFKMHDDAFEERFGSMTKEEVLMQTDEDITRKLQVYETAMLLMSIINGTNKSVRPERPAPVSAVEESLLNRITMMTQEEIIALYGKTTKSQIINNNVPLTEEALAALEKKANTKKISRIPKKERKRLYGLKLAELSAKSTLTHDTLEILKLIQRTDDSTIKKLFGAPKKEVLRRDNLTLDYMLSLGVGEFSLQLLISHDEAYRIARLYDDSHSNIEQKRIASEHREVLSKLKSMTWEDSRAQYGWVGGKTRIGKDYPLSYALLKHYEKVAIINRLNNGDANEIVKTYGQTNEQLTNNPDVSYDTLISIITEKNRLELSKKSPEKVEQENKKMIKNLNERINTRIKNGAIKV